MPSTLTILSGTANPELAAGVAEELGVFPPASTLETFPDGEIEVELRQSVRGHDVYLIQSTSPPVDRHLIELALLADACRRCGAERVTAVVPYFGYGRQDRRGHRRQALGGRVMADLIEAVHVHRIIVVDLHTPAIEGFFVVPVEHLSAVPVLADAVRPAAHDRSVVVAPDLGAIRLAQQYARLLGLPMALVRKTRLSGREVAVTEVVGDVRDRAPLIVDDMLSTGGTVVAAMRALAAAGSRSEGIAVVSHGLFVGSSEEALLALPLQKILTTDSVMQRPGRLPIEVHSLGPMLAETIRRLHAGEPLGDVYSAVRGRTAASR